MEEKKEEVIEVEIGNLYVEFRKPYKFEGKEYKGIDLSGLENLTASDLAAVDRTVQHRAYSTRDLLGVTSDHIMHFSALATGQPIEFFKGLPLKDAARVNAVVAGFLLA